MGEINKKDNSKKQKVFGFVDAIQSGNTFGPRENGPKATPTAKDATGPGALAGIKVVEFASLITGPMATTFLADAGADVVKVEIEGELDRSRTIGPQATENMGTMFLALGRNKRSVLVKKGEVNPSRTTLVRTMGSNVEKLLSWADVVVTDAASSTAFGLDVAHISEKYPAMIIAEIKESPGEFNLQAKTGMAGCQLDDDGNGSYVKTMVCEKAGALYAAFSIEAALHEQLRSRKGQVLMLDMLAMACHFGSADVHFNVDGACWTPETLAKPDAVKTTIPLKPIYTTIPFKDGEPGYMIAVSDKEWKGFCDAFADIIKDDPCAPKVQKEWKTLAGRIGDPNVMVEITALYEKVASRFTRDEAEKRAFANDLPFGQPSPPIFCISFFKIFLFCFWLSLLCVCVRGLNSDALYHNMYTDMHNSNDSLNNLNK